MKPQERREDATTGALTVRQSGELATTAAATRAEAEVKAAYARAMMSPRKMDIVSQRLMSDCEDLDLAENAMYSRPVGKKDGKQQFATGESVHLMRRVMANMGNIRSTANAVYDDDERTIILVRTVDFETNAGYEAELNMEKTVERSSERGREVVRTRPNAWGKTTYTVRAFDHEFRQKCKAEIAKTVRDQIKDLAPLSLRSAAVAKCKETIKAAIYADPSGYLKRVIAKFEDLRPKVTGSDVMRYLGCSYQDVTPEQIIDLLAIYRGVREGEDTWETMTAERTPPKAELKPTDGRQKWGFDQEAEPEIPNDKHQQDQEEPPVDEPLFPEESIQKPKATAKPKPEEPKAIRQLRETLKIRCEQNNLKEHTRREAEEEMLKAGGVSSWKQITGPDIEDKCMGWLDAVYPEQGGEE